MTEEMMIVLVVFFVVGVPVMGLTARLAIKPLVESILRVREAFLADSRGEQVSAAEVERLEHEVQELRDEVRRLTAATEFDRKLLGSDEG
ncbi:MAG: hypothetical protein R6U63_15120 [Longimicrobiales bacterium]